MPGLYFVVALAAALLTGALWRSALAGALVGVGVLVGWYAFLPPAHHGFSPLWWTLVLAVVVGGGIRLGVLAARNAGEKRPLSLAPSDRVGIGVASAAVVGLLFAYLFSSGVVHAERFRTLLGPVDEVASLSDMGAVDLENLRVVDAALARRLAMRRLGDDTALGSITSIDRLHLQSVNGRLYWVGPLNHSGFFRWFSNREGTPGYVMVSATNENDFRIVRELDGAPLRLRFNEGSWFGDRLARHLRREGLATRGIADHIFEIDDTGRPFWVTTLYENRVGLRGPAVTGAVITDAQTGEVSVHTVEDTPAWVDRIQPIDFVEQQIRWNGRYVAGWWNPARLGVVAPTPGTALVFSTEGVPHYYTGLTSAGADDGTVGFMLVNSRTGAARFVRESGATEEAVRRSAEGMYQAEGYRASFPIRYQIAGAGTYFMPVKDRGGLNRGYAMVNTQNDQIVGTGEDLGAALRAYRRALASRGGEVTLDATVDVREVEGRVLRAQADVRSGESAYYLVVEGAEGVVLTGGSSLTAALPLTREGDRVRVAFVQGRSGVVDLVAFENLDLPIAGEFREGDAGDAGDAEDAEDAVDAEGAEEAEDAEGVEEAEGAGGAEDAEAADGEGREAGRS